jgi:ribose 5-phosphate isomerase B
MCRLHNDANILVMGGRVIGVALALEMVDNFLTVPFEGGRHNVRLNQIDSEAYFGGKKLTTD